MSDFFGHYLKLPGLEIDFDPPLDVWRVTDSSGDRTIVRVASFRILKTTPAGFVVEDWRQRFVLEVQPHQISWSVPPRRWAYRSLDHAVASYFRRRVRAAQYHKRYLDHNTFILSKEQEIRDALRSHS